MKPLILIALLSGSVWACPKGSTEWEGVCSADLAPQVAEASVKPLDDKPSRHPQAAWERGEVKAAMPESLSAQDAKQDKEQVDAIHSGKHAAGLE